MHTWFTGVGSVQGVNKSQSCRAGRRKSSAQGRLGKQVERKSGPFCSRKPQPGLGSHGPEPGCAGPLPHLACALALSADQGFSGGASGKESTIFLPRESHGQGSLVGYSPWSCKESDTAEAT